MKFIKTIIVLILLSCSLVFLPTNKVNANQIDDRAGIPVILYHHMLKKNENFYRNNLAVINVESFEEQMKYLYEKGYYTATVEELIAYMRGEINLPTKTVVITFDDGHKTNYIYAYPILKKYGFRATGFLITNRISETPVSFNPNELQFLSWPEINEMKDVFTFGGHTHNLHYITSADRPALVSMPENLIVEDLQLNRNLLPTEYFAYPFGTYNERTIELLKLAGYKYAFTTDEKNAKKGTGFYEIGRKGVFPNTNIKKFENLVNREYLKVGWSKIDDHWFYMNQDKTFHKGWLKSNNKWYYLDQTGLMKTGWVKELNIWYFLDKSGVMATGWLKDGQTWYYLDGNGAMKTGWVKSANKWYYLNSSGAMNTGWLFDRSNWYYLNRSGAMETGWRIVNGTWYYFYNDGRMASNTTIGRYKIGVSGAWIN